MTTINENTKMPLRWVVGLITAVAGAAVTATLGWSSLKADNQEIKRILKADVVTRTEWAEWRDDLAEENKNIIKVPRIKKLDDNGKGN